VLAACRAEPIRESEEVFLVDRIEHRDDRTLDDLVLQRRDSQRALPAVRLRYEPAPNGQCPVRAAMDSFIQRLKLCLQIRLVVLPCHAVHPGSGMTLERQKRIPERIDSHMVQQRGELLLLPLPCDVPYTLQPR
jgi:hypothetical protein